MKMSATRVSIVEDLPFIRTFIRETINHMKGYTLSLEAERGEELLERLAQASQLPEILLLDISLFQMDGYDVMKVIAGRYPSIKVLALSVHREKFAVVQIMRLGARGFLEKDHMEDLSEALACISSGKLYFSAGIRPEWIQSIKQQSRPVMLTTREKQTLRFCAGGFIFKQIADVMGITEKTAHEYKDRVFKKLDVHNGSAMVRVAMGAGLLRIGEEIPSWEEEMSRKKKHGRGG